MRIKQVGVALILGVISAYTLFQQDLSTFSVIGVGVGVYVFVRIIFGTVGRVHHWYPRGTQGVHYQRCPNCQKDRYRMGGDWILQCHKCGWKPGFPILRWFTRSVPVHQLRRSINISRLIVVIIAASMVWIGLSGALVGTIDPADSEGFFQLGGTENEELNTTEVELLVVKYTNEERTSRGLGEVEFSSRIAKPARNHSQTMAEHDFIGHTSPDGETAEERYSSVCSYTGSGYLHGENAGGAWYEQEFSAWKTDEELYLSNESEVARYLVDQWMRSEGHRENILVEGWQEIGVGVVVRDDGKVFATQTFC